jgi:predicted GTPase
MLAGGTSGLHDIANRMTEIRLSHNSNDSADSSGGSSNAAAKELSKEAREKSKAEAEPRSDMLARVIPRAEAIANQIRAQPEQDHLAAGEVNSVAALLALLADKSATTICAMTIVYNLSNGRNAAKGEAAVVWRADSRIEKTIKQFLRVLSKLAQAASATETTPMPGDEILSTVASNIEIVANAYEISSSSYDSARYSLALLLMLLGISLNVGHTVSTPSVWLQPVDIHSETPIDITRVWNPVAGTIVLTIKGPWPWGDSVRAKVSNDERTELALKMIGGDGEIADISRLEMGTNDAIKQKGEQHVFILGESGAGKSSTGNILTGETAFYVDSTKTGTMFPQPYMCTWGTGGKQVVWDTPGLNDAKQRDALFLREISLVIDRVQLATAVILVLRSPSRLPHSLLTALESYVELFGPNLASVLYVVINESSRIYSPDEIEMFNNSMADQLEGELGIVCKPGFLLQIPTSPQLQTVELQNKQEYNAQWLKQAIIQTKPVMTRAGHQTIESLLALRTTLDVKQQAFYRKQLLDQSTRQREGLQMLLSRADVRKAFFSKRGYVLIQTWDLSRASRVLQVLQQQDSRLQQRRELRITPDNAEVGELIAEGLRDRKKRAVSRKEVRATTPESFFEVISELELVLIPLSVPALATDDAADPENKPLTGEQFAAARPGERVSQRTLRAIGAILEDTTCADSVIRMVQACLAESVEAEGGIMHV